MKRYVRCAETTSQFEIGKEYKLYRKDLTEAKRTFFVDKISRKNEAIQVHGGINGIFRIKESKGCELILLGMNDRNYINPSSDDVV